MTGDFQYETDISEPVPILNDKGFRDENISVSSFESVVIFKASL